MTKGNTAADETVKKVAKGKVCVMALMQVGKPDPASVEMTVDDIRDNQSTATPEEVELWKKRCNLGPRHRNLKEWRGIVGNQMVGNNVTPDPDWYKWLFSLTGWQKSCVSVRLFS